MTLVQGTLEASDTGIVNADTPDGLSAIRQPGCAAVIWERRPLPRFQNWINGLAPERLPSARIILRPELVCDALLNITRACGLSEGSGRDLLIDDVSALAAIFADVMRVDYLRLRLGVTNDNACRKFHIDAVTARLVCTYRGTGTQYGVSTDGSDPSHVSTVPTGSPIILRGTHWPEAPISGLLHRSPPIEGTGETRLVLVLDPVEDPSAEPDRRFMH
ncbi:MAG: DUF1826 domain-containing protein [Pseudomonadota bacterium]